MNIKENEKKLGWDRRITCLCDLLGFASVLGGIGMVNWAHWLSEKKAKSWQLEYAPFYAAPCLCCVREEAGGFQVCENAGRRRGEPNSEMQANF